MYLQTSKKLLQLWYHECCRVFQDRLVNNEDRDWFDALLKSRISTDFELDPDEVIGPEGVLFGDFHGSTDVRIYQIINDIKHVITFFFSLVIVKINIYIIKIRLKLFKLIVHSFILHSCNFLSTCVHFSKFLNTSLVVQAVTLRTSDR